MSIKSILAAYSGDATGSSGLRLALHMAEKYGAHLTGVVSHGPSLMETRYSRYMSSEVLEILRSRDTEVIDAIRADFATSVDAAGLQDRASFLDLRRRSDFVLAECARTYDIVVMGRRASEPGREHFIERPDEIALRSGRPVILVPQEYDVKRLGEDAVIAWDGTRAAARALGDAMHILSTKSKVTVLTVGDVDPVSCGDDVTTHLARHGITAQHLIRPASGRVSATILDTCHELRAGLLVMGAYERSKISEDFFGGVTRDILEDADVPVLFSH